jgi:hypothetical protein
MFGMLPLACRNPDYAGHSAVIRLDITSLFVMQFGDRNG